MSGARRSCEILTKPFQIDEVINVFDLLDDVVVELKLHKRLESLQVLYLPNICKP